MIEFYDEKIVTRNIIISKELYFILRALGINKSICSYHDIPNLDELKEDFEDKQYIQELKDLIDLCNDSFKNNECTEIKLSC